MPILASVEYTDGYIGELIYVVEGEIKVPLTNAGPLINHMKVPPKHTSLLSKTSTFLKSVTGELASDIKTSIVMHHGTVLAGHALTIPTGYVVSTIVRGGAKAVIVKGKVSQGTQAAAESLRIIQGVLPQDINV